MALKARVVGHIALFSIWPPRRFIRTIFAGVSRKGVELERERKTGGGGDEPEKYSRGDRLAKRDDDSSEENSRARQVLRTERDEANAPATATNYASTELNLKDRRVPSGRKGEERGGGEGEGEGAIRADRET